MAACELCGKKRQVGNNVSHAKNRTKRVYLPNVHRMRAKIEGTVRRVYVCSTCLRSGAIVKA